ncbi:hemolysin (plasmid) [Tistrella mobilis]|uniref:hemolysin n=1 Tax=Tistrella mobilis TaxID=171437 RepID=UPI003558109B
MADTPYATLTPPSGWSVYSNQGAESGLKTTVSLSSGEIVGGDPAFLDSIADAFYEVALTAVEAYITPSNIEDPLQNWGDFLTSLKSNTVIRDALDSIANVTAVQAVQAVAGNTVQTSGSALGELQDETLQDATDAIFSELNSGNVEPGSLLGWYQYTIHTITQLLTSTTLQFQKSTVGNAVEIYLGLDGQMVAASNSSSITYSGNNSVVVQGGAADDLLTSGSRDDVLVGWAGNDIMIASEGKDTYIGGDGTDTVDYSGFHGFATPLKASLATGKGTSGPATGHSYVGVEVLIGTAGGDDLTANGAGTTLYGGGGNDVLRDTSTTGSATLNGGDGNDTASYFGRTQGITASLSAPGDTTGYLISIENLYGTDYNDVLVGNSENNILTGLEGNDTLVGRGGADTLDGRGGSDTASYQSASSSVTADLRAGNGTQGDAAGDTLISIENLTGSAYGDKLYGDSAANVLRGGNGDDALRGRGGADTLDGGNGFDFASYSDATASVTVDLASGKGLAGEALGDTLVSIEGLAGSGYDDLLQGDGNDNYFYGNGGNDILRGRGGADTFDGGSGLDFATYSDASASVVADLASGGISGEAEGDVYISIEGLTGTSYADTLHGDAGSNTLVGRDGDDILNGRRGADQLIGGDGFDFATYSEASAAVAVDLASQRGTAGEAKDDILTEIEGLIGSAYGDTLSGNKEVNHLRGEAGNDVLDGRGGADLLQGGAGADQLTGGTGADNFLYLNLSDSGKTSGTWDTITDFSQTDGDKIDVSAIDAYVGSPGNQTFTFIGSAGYSGTPGELRANVSNGYTYIGVDVDGDQASDMVIRLNGIHTLTAADFVL